MVYRWKLGRDLKIEQGRMAFILGVNMFDHERSLEACTVDRSRGVRYAFASGCMHNELDEHTFEHSSC